MAAPMGLISAGEDLNITEDVTEEATGPAYQYTGRKQEDLGLFANDATTEVAVNTEVGTEVVDMKPRLLGKKDTPVPELLVGPRFKKAMRLSPGVWMRIGRDKQESAIWLDDTGVSRRHFSIRWDAKSRTVEIKDSSHSGTLVNGQVVINDRRPLQHGCNVRIEGKRTRYEFILDLRPVNLAMSDPLTVSTSGGQGTSKSLIHKRDQLRSQVRQLEELLFNKETQIFDQEQKFYEIASRSMKRGQEDKAMEEKHAMIIEEERELTMKIKEGRKTWLEKLKAEYEVNDESIKPIIEATKELQDKLAKLDMKKMELERQIYPERFAVADLPTHPELTEKPDVDGLSVNAEDDDGEEEAFAGPGLTHPSPAVSLSAVAGLAQAKSQPEGSAPEEEVPLDPDELFGQIEGEVDGDNDDAPLVPAAKKQKL
eukprot:TRINITY_DN79535_c0_g1_i1.p1 TRINITY_DN79535_c0_g1~~TRINITY_DN79535_c0_g1_i1.p1  ORF type:complete len:426 (-),score=127.04 TRINITY_DN79535_c0_g1_i1:73-1350(-)